MKKKNEVEKQTGEGEVEAPKKKRGRKPKTVMGDAPSTNAPLNGVAS